MDLESKLNNCPKKYGNSEKTFENVLNAHTPKKTKFLRGNQKPHVGKNFRKAIMKNKANRTKQLENITKYKKQQNLVVELNRESKTNILTTYRHLKTQRLFGISVSPIFQINMLTVTLK